MSPQSLFFLNQHSFPRACPSAVYRSDQNAQRVKTKGLQMVCTLLLLSLGPPLSVEEDTATMVLALIASRWQAVVGPGPAERVARALLRQVKCGSGSGRKSA